MKPGKGLMQELEWRRRAPFGIVGEHMRRIGRPLVWKLSPAANCPGLPVNYERNEG